jgi:hypothetical protein
MRSKAFVVRRFHKLDIALALGRAFPHPEGMAVCRHHVEVGADPEDFEVVMTYEVLDSEVIVEMKP